MVESTPAPSVLVVAAVIRRGRALLVARRPAAKRHGGMWEFPGGKVLPGESLADAATRELSEELDLAVTRVGPVLFDAADPGSAFLIRFVEVDAEGAPVAHEHDALAWRTPAEMEGLPLAPADARFVRERLR